MANSSDLITDMGAKRAISSSIFTLLNTIGFAGNVVTLRLNVSEKLTENVVVLSRRWKSFSAYTFYFLVLALTIADSTFLFANFVFLIPETWLGDLSIYELASQR